MSQQHQHVIRAPGVSETLWGVVVVQDPQDPPGTGLRLVQSSQDSLNTRLRSFDGVFEETRLQQVPESLMSRPNCSFLFVDLPSESSSGRVIAIINTHFLRAPDVSVQPFITENI